MEITIGNFLTELCIEELVERYRENDIFPEYGEGAVDEDVIKQALKNSIEKYLITLLTKHQEVYINTLNLESYIENLLLLK